MNKQLLEYWLEDFKNHPAKKWFDEKTFVKNDIISLMSFLKKLEIEILKMKKIFLKVNMVLKKCVIIFIH